MDALSQTTFSTPFSWMKMFELSLKYVPKGLINNIPALVQIMAWHWMLTRLCLPLIIRSSLVTSNKDKTYCFLIEPSELGDRSQNDCMVVYTGCIWYWFLRSIKTMSRTYRYSHTPTWILIGFIFICPSYCSCSGMCRIRYTSRFVFYRQVDTMDSSTTYIRQLASSSHRQRWVSLLPLFVLLLPMMTVVCVMFLWSSTQCGMVTSHGIVEKGHHWFRWCLVTRSAPSHFPNNRGVSQTWALLEACRELGGVYSRLRMVLYVV